MGSPLIAELVKNLPAMRETWVQSLGWEDPLEKGKATHSSILTWEFHELYSPWGCKESNTTEQLSLSLKWSPEARRGSSRALPLKISRRKTQSQVPTGKHVPGICYKESTPQELRQKPSPLWTLPFSSGLWFRTTPPNTHFSLYKIRCLSFVRPAFGPCLAYLSKTAIPEQTHFASKISFIFKVSDFQNLVLRIIQGNKKHESS